MSTSYAIVLYAYNQQDYVREAARSVLAQTCRPTDILFTDDCSTDGTFDILREEAERYDGPHRIRLNRNKVNLGVIEHVHRVFQLCDADMMINCAGDDLSHPDRARRIMELCEREAPLLVFSEAKVETLDGAPAPPRYRSATFYHRRDAGSAATSMQLYLGATCAWHKDLVRRFGPVTEDVVFEDLVYGFRAALEGRVGYIDEALVTYRVGAGVTNTARQAEKLDAVKTRRATEIGREAAVLRQRLKDAQTFGLAPKDRLCRRLTIALRQRETRTAFIEGDRTALRGAIRRHPIETSVICLSEARKWRRQACRNA
ncbi:glycosyltransferase [Roseovarius aestuariivivens]|uniref:glycosyltransferase n=1 Tax=Roseovarius aestuariivivens TaxID=1888910 RepID=UPI00108168C4|nr:glycosyltransferase [Roseovarius aestuariivivens]